MVYMRKNKQKKPLSLRAAALSCLLVFIFGCVPEHFVRLKTDIGNIKRVAVLPFENFTSDGYAGEKIRRLNQAR
jgi:hypothetical protein